MSSIQRFLYPIKASLTSITPSSPLFSISKKPICGRSGLLKFLPTHVYAESQSHALTFGRVLQRKFYHTVNLSGQKLFVGSFLGFSAVTSLICQQPSVVYAVDENYADMEEPSGFLKDDLHTFWSLARKFHLPLVLLATVLLGWRHPISLAINVTLLLFSTRPNPYSIYMFVEQLRQTDMHRDPSLLKTKFFYVKKVEVEDYKILCLAKVELRDLKIDVIGILGGWWVFRTSPTHSS